MNLDESFIKYKDITLTIVETVKVEEYEKLDELFNRRQLILDTINKVNPQKEELRKVYLKYNIDYLEEKLEIEIKFRKASLLKKMKQNENKQVGMAGYNKLSAKAVFLSKQI